MGKNAAHREKKDAKNAIKNKRALAGQWVR
jgi:hypothetical protein